MFQKFLFSPNNPPSPSPPLVLSVLRSALRLLVTESYVIFMLLIEYWNKLTLLLLTVLYFLKIFYLDMAHVYLHKKKYPLNWH
jgi:hypothetical protein